MNSIGDPMGKKMKLESTIAWIKRFGRQAVLLTGAAVIAILAGGEEARALDPAALPTGGQIVAGQGQIDTSGTAMTVTQTSERMVADWNTFNIGSNALVTFNQPGAASAALNRICDTSPSQIFGRLSANGQVFLLNPAGILFGATAQVDVGGLVASSLGLSNDAFMAGNFTFDSSSAFGSILNQGTIRTADGGYVAFIAPHVENQGEIFASGGTVAMAAGDRVSLDFTGDSLVNFIVDRGAVDALAKNSGTIRADGGTVLLTAKAADALTRSVVNNTGVIEAKSLTEKNGRIVLDADGGQTTVSGTLDVSSSQGQGGRIIATGDRVLVASGAHLNASGVTGGGEVLVGGSWQGGDSSIRQAAGTIIETGALLEANATDTGDGGTVVAWSDVTDPLSVTRAYGTFEAMGGPNGGNGGRIETSGHWLDTAGSIGSAGTFSGSPGLWLFDPYNITIAGAANANGGWSGANPNVWTPSGSGSTILNTDLNAKLASTDVTITTTGGGAEEGNITVTGAITIPSSRNLKLLADGSVTISANISGSGGRLFLQSGASGAANKAITINNKIGLGSGQLTLTSTGGATSNAEIDAYGLLALYGSGAFNINSHSGTSDFDYFTANLTGAGSSIDLYENNDFFYITSAGVTCPGNVTLRALRDFTVTGPINITGNGNLNLAVGTGSFINVNAPIALNSGAMTFTTESGSSTYTISKSVTASGAGLSFDQPVTLSGTPEIRANGTLAFNAALTLASGVRSVLAANSFTFSGNVTGNGTQQLTLMPYAAGGNLNVGSGGDVNTTASQFTGFSSLTLGRSDGTGTLTVVGDTTVSANQLELVYKTVNVSGGTLANTVGDIIFTGDNFDISKGVSAKGGTGKVTLRQLTAANPITLGTSYSLTNGILNQISAGTLELGRADGGNVSFIGNITTTANNLVVLSGGNITLGSGVTLNAGTGTATMAAGGHFINNSGAGAISTSGDGRWLIYSAGPAGDTFGGLASGNAALWNKTYAGYAPTSVTETGSRYLFSTQPSLTFTAANKTKTYGQTLNLGSPAAGTDYTVSGLIDAATYGNVFTQDSYSGTPSLASTGAAATANVAGSPYTLAISAGTLANPTGYGAATFTNGALTVNKAALTVTAANDSRTYNGNTYSGGNGATYSGFVNSETATVLGGSLAYGGTSQGAKNAGTYAINPSGLTSGNYALSFANGALTINKAALSITAQANTKVYDATTISAAAPVVSGLLGTDTATGLTQAYADKNVGTGKTLTVSGYTINDGNGGNNYNVGTVANTAGIITAKPLTAAYTGVNKVYDATTAATATGSSADIIAGDAVTFAQSVAFTDKNAGNGKTVNVSSISLGGIDAGNYSLQNTTAATTATITAKNLTAAYTGVNKVYDATTAATATGGSADIIAGDAVTFGQSAAFTDKNVGTSKTVNVSSITIGGTDAGNYSLQNTTAATTADITVKGIAAIAITAEDKVFDGTAVAELNTTTAGLSGVVAGDAVSLDTTSSSGAFANPYVGGKKTVTVTGLILSGNDATNYTLAGYRTTANITPVATPDNLASPQKSTNGTQLDQSGPQGSPGGSAMGPGGGSTTLASASTSPLVSGMPPVVGNSVLTSSQFVAPVSFSTVGSTTTMEIGGGTGSGSLVEVGTLPVFNQSGQSIPVERGSIIIRESPSALSLTQGALSGAGQFLEFGGLDAPAVPFALVAPSGVTLQLTASVTTEGMLVIDMPDAAVVADPSKAVLMGMTILKKEQNIDVGMLKGVLLRQN